MFYVRVDLVMFYVYKSTTSLSLSSVMHEKVICTVRGTNKNQNQRAVLKIESGE